VRNLLLVGDIETLAPYAQELEAQGFFVTLRSPRSSEAMPEDVGLMVIDLASASEDPELQSLLTSNSSGEPVPIVGLASPQHVESFELIRDLEDFVRRDSPVEDLVARVRRIIWKHDRVDARNVLAVGDLVMDLANYTVQVGGRTVDLTYKEYELLRFLATNRERVFSRETLLSKVWGYDFYGGARTVDVHVRRLRSKIEDRHRTFIETVRNVGYRFRAVP
jgi:DNA-binding response OmpR family regulator